MSLSRRSFLALGPAAATAAGNIDRRSLVSRHNPVLTQFDTRSPLSVGNGELAFTADLTGLQTFPELYEKGCPLCTQSQWGWHSFPPLNGLGPDNLRMTLFDSHGRQVGYPSSPAGQIELFNWLRENPHRLHLGRIGFRLDARPEDLRDTRQELDLWTGTLKSRFSLRGAPVVVDTCVHPESDALAVRVQSPVLKTGALDIELAFPYGSPGILAADWNHPERHSTRLEAGGEGFARLERTLDGDHYSCAVAWKGGARFEPAGPHRFVLRPAADRIEVVYAFAPGTAQPHAGDVFAASQAHWPRFWSGGGAVELEARDARAAELERRIILSQYLTAIQCAGTMPPQETGLTCNSWFGKFHLEMHWWHAAHFPLWGRPQLLERSLPWYRKILPQARQIARRQGYEGVRWPKMVGPEGRDSPSAIGPFLIWQQPHFIAMAELCRGAKTGRKWLGQYADLVFESAEFMASFAAWDGQRFVLGPPVIPAQENHPPKETWNPTFELEYWHYGLGIAQRWRAMLGLQPNPRWERVRAGLSALPVRDGVYLAHENCPQTYTARNRDHPSMLGALGVLPGSKADAAVMRRTLDKVLAVWQWPDTWGWDYPMMAMTAARLGDPEGAVHALMLDTAKNRWLPNGHTWQRANLPLYLPSNGGLLAACALMAAGWRGGPRRPAPGFPQDWTVRQDGLGALL